MIYKDTLTTHQWSPKLPATMEYIANERQWLLLDNQAEKCAFFHIYVACQTNRSDSFMQCNEDLFHLDTQEFILH